MKRLSFLGIVIGLLLLAGCKQSVDHLPEILKIQSGSDQSCRAGEECENFVNIQTLGTLRQKSVTGGKRLPSVGVKVKVTPMEEGASAIPAEGVSDSGGNFRFKVKLAPLFGDQYFKVECPDFPDVKPVFVHTIAGVSVIGADQETLAGDELLSPIQVVVTDAQGKPTPQMPVFFSLKSGPAQAKISEHYVKTNEEGVARVRFKTVAGYTGKYEITAEVGQGQQRARGIVIKALGMSRTNLIIGVLGGLSIFIFGMMLMSEGLQQIAGDKLKGLLQLFTENRVKAMLAGLVITSLIQSSGACTVMVVGFVNAALLTLNQAIGVILGAAIGTTVTAQMVSFKLDALALPAVALGVLSMLIAKKHQAKGIASTILGFGLLFYGMLMMSSQLKSISEFPTFISFFNKFDCTPLPGHVAPPMLSVLGAILVGTVMTIVVQSSSATVGLAIALADSGLMNFYTAVPLILGDNIGSTITGLMGALTASKPARQSAVASMIFKLLAVLIMLPLFYVPIQGRPCFLYLVDMITSGDVFAEIPENIGRHLASAHTLFNICSVVVFLPFVDFLAVLAKCLVPDRNKAEKDDSVIYHLETRLLSTPSAALSQVLMALVAMTGSAMDLARKALEGVANPNESLSENEVNRLEGRIDQEQHLASDYLVQLTRQNLNFAQSRAIPIFMHCVNDVERIGDRAVNIFQLIPTLKQANMAFSKEALDEVAEIQRQLEKMVEILMNILRKNDLDSVQKVVLIDAEIRRMTERNEHRHEERLQDKDCTVERGIVFVELLANLERISAHLTNVAERAKDMLPHSVAF